MEELNYKCKWCGRRLERWLDAYCSEKCKAEHGRTDSSPGPRSSPTGGCAAQMFMFIVATGILCALGLARR